MASQITATKPYSLPFSNSENSESAVEEAAVFATTELDRNKGSGLLNRQPTEKLMFLAKAGYPLWLYPRNSSILVFDGLGDSVLTIAYSDTASSKAFMEKLAEARTKDDYLAFLLHYTDYFGKPLKEKQFVLKGLISTESFQNEFGIYHKEGTIEAANIALLPPALSETAISVMIAEFDKVHSELNTESKKLSEFIKQLNKTTSQYLIEIDYTASAAKEEIEAKILAEQELIKPQIAKLTKSYIKKIRDTSKNFEKQLKSLQQLKKKKAKSAKNVEAKIKLYQRNAKAQAKKRHAIYEKRWKEKSKQSEKKLEGLKKELDRIEDSIADIGKRKIVEIGGLDSKRDAEIHFIQQPLMQLEAERDAKMNTFKQESDRLMLQEKPVIEELNKALQTYQTIDSNFKLQGIDANIGTPTLMYIQFYIACYDNGQTKRYLTIPPSKIGALDLSSKLKGAFGISRIKEVLSPRFKSITPLIDGVSVHAKWNPVFDAELLGLGERGNLLKSRPFLENVVRGLDLLRRDGWINEREQQDLGSRLSS